jgi:hypothetical protein
VWICPAPRIASLSDLPWGLGFFCHQDLFLLFCCAATSLMIPDDLPHLLSSEHGLCCVTSVVLFMESKQWTLLIRCLAPIPYSIHTSGIVHMASFMTAFFTCHNVLKVHPCCVINEYYMFTNG